MTQQEAQECVVCTVLNDEFDDSQKGKFPITISVVCNL